MITRDLIKKQINDNAILLYMKGTPQFPMCGFSAQVVKVLQSMNTKFNYINVLSNLDIRKELPKYANWPTFPQLYIKGELFGGCDIVMEAYKTGELLSKLKEAII